MSRTTLRARYRAALVASMALALFTGTATAANAAGRERIVNLSSGRCLQANSHDGAVFTGGCEMGAGDQRALWDVPAIGRAGISTRIFWADGGCLASSRGRNVVVSQWCKSANSMWTRAADGKLVNAATGRCLTDEHFGYVFLSNCAEGLVVRQAWRTGAR